MRRYSGARKSIFSHGLGGKDEVFYPALVCIAVLYGVDAQFFAGQYTDGIERALSDILRQ